MTKKKRAAAVIVTWTDACQVNDGFSESFGHTPAIVHTVGFLLRSDKAGVSIAAEVNADDGHLRDVTFIPRGMVVKVRRLR